MDASPFIKSGLIEPYELKALLDSPESSKIALLDATFCMPSDPKNPRADFEQAHIGQARYFDVDHDFADPASPLPHMLCHEATFAEKIGAMGVSNDDFVVIYGQTGMIMGPPRAWWSFKVFGHEKVAVLNGGLPAWIKAGLPVNQGKPTPRPHQAYKAHMTPALVKSLAQMQAISGSGTQMLDARPADRFTGAAPEPRPGLKRGHIPGSLNLPCAKLVDPETGKFLPSPALEALFSTAGHKSGQPAVLTCGSGVTACALALALHTIGERDWSVYDGAWSEWGLVEADRPVSTG